MRSVMTASIQHSNVTHTRMREHINVARKWLGKQEKERMVVILLYFAALKRTLGDYATVAREGFG